MLWRYPDIKFYPLFLLQGQYDEELQQYLKRTGLQASDLVKQRKDKKHKETKESKQHHQQQQSAEAAQPAAAQTVQNAAAVQQPVQGQAALMGLPLVPAGLNGPASVSFQSTAGGQAVLSGLPHFQHVWTGQGQDQQPLLIQQAGQPQQVLIQAVNGATTDGVTTSSAPILIQPQQANGQGVQFLRYNNHNSQFGMPSNQNYPPTGGYFSNLLSGRISPDANVNSFLLPTNQLPPPPGYTDQGSG